jgi:hypothetical protein
MDDLWESLAGGDLHFGDGAVIDAALGEEDAYLRFAASLPPEKGLGKMRQNKWLGRRPQAGTRVAFDETVEALMTYTDFPTPGIGSEVAEGTVIAVRTSSGDTTAQGSRVYVMWDDGRMRAIEREHLRPAPGLRRTAHCVRRVVAGMGDLTDFLRGSTGSTDLVHKSTQDLWSLRKEGDGYVIERMFDSNGEALKGV